MVGKYVEQESEEGPELSTIQTPLGWTRTETVSLSSILGFDLTNAILEWN